MTIIDGLYRGSNTDKDKFYHKNWFGNESYQRQDSEMRIKFLMSNYDFTNKSVIDLGCNIGFFSFGIDKLNSKKVTGIDYDKKAIEFANDMKQKNTIKNVDFINSEITIDKLKEIGKVDCILGLAVHSWIMHQSGKEKMEEIINWSSKNSKVNFIELQYVGEPGQLDWLKNDNDCKKYLKKWFKYVYKIGEVSSWGPRTLWKCFNDFGDFKLIYNNRRTKCYVSDNMVFKKERINKNITFDNEIKYLKKLSDEAFSPKIISYNKDELYLSGINGFNLEFLTKKGFKIDIEHFKFILFNILYTLEKYDIKHQDICFENVIISIGGDVYLVDYEYASSLNGSLKNKLQKENTINNITMGKELINKLKMSYKFFNNEK